MTVTTRTKAGTSKESAAKRKKAFAIAYTSNGRNGKQAAIAAGYSPNCAEVTASRLIREPNVRDMIESLTVRAEEITALSADEALRANARVVRFDIRKLYQEDGTPFALRDLDDDTAMALSHMGQHGPVPSDRLRALDMAFKNMGLYEKDNTQRGDSLPVLQVMIVK